jgi:nucleotide-binding universal stress UspA family protein
MYKKILVPLDGSEISEQALEHVKEIMPVPSTTEITLLRVVDPLATTYAGGTDAAIEVAVEIQKKAAAVAAAYLKRVKGELKDLGIQVKTVLTVGIPADVILDYARQNGVGLIIMSTHGRSGISRWFFGSVAEKIIRHSPVPVLISPPRGSRGAD